MTTRRFAPVLAAAALLAGTACGPSVDLGEALEVTDVLTGWYDNGPRPNGSHVVPSINFRLRNDSDSPLSSVLLTVVFWRDGDDGEWDSKLVTGIDEHALAPGASTEPILVRLPVGYNQPGPLNEIFENSQFKDATVRIFARRSGHIVPIGEFPIERRIIPHVFDAGRP
jgi:hypothetical protein